MLWMIVIGIMSDREEMVTKMCGNQSQKSLPLVVRELNGKE
jgi:hypothetical protein